MVNAQQHPNIEQRFLGGEVLSSGKNDLVLVLEELLKWLGASEL